MDPIIAPISGRSLRLNVSRVLTETLFPSSVKQQTQTQPSSCTRCRLKLKDTSEVTLWPNPNSTHDTLPLMDGSFHLLQLSAAYFRNQSLGYLFVYIIWFISCSVPSVMDGTLPKDTIRTQQIPGRR